MDACVPATSMSRSNVRVIAVSTGTSLAAFIGPLYARTGGPIVRNVNVSGPRLASFPSTSRYPAEIVTEKSVATGQLLSRGEEQRARAIPCERALGFGGHLEVQLRRGLLDGLRELDVDSRVGEADVGIALGAPEGDRLDRGGHAVQQRRVSQDQEERDHHNNALGDLDSTS